MFWFGLFTQLPAIKLKHNLAVFLRKDLKSKKIMGLFRSQVKMDFSIHSFFQVVLNFLTIFVEEGDLLMDLGVSYQIEALSRRFFPEVDFQVINRKMEQFGRVYASFEATLQSMVGSLDVSVLSWANVNLTSYQNLFSRYESQYANLWLSIPSLDASQSAVNQYFSKYSNILNSTGSSVSSIQAKLAPAISNTLRSSVNVSSLPSLSRVPSLNTSVGPVDALPGLPSIDSRINFNANGRGPQRRDPDFDFDMPDLNMDMDMNLDMDLDSMFDADAGSQAFDFRNVSFSVEYPARYRFRIFVANRPQLALSFSVKSMFGSYQKEYLFVAKNIDRLRFRSGRFFILTRRRKRVRVSRVISDLLRFRHKGLFKYLGRVRLSGPRLRDARFPLTWNCYSKGGSAAFSLKLHSFEFEFNHLAKYFLSHLGSLKIRKSAVGFHNWFNHWVFIKNRRISKFFLSVWRQMTSSRSVSVQTTRGPNVRKSVQVISSSTHPSGGGVFMQSASVPVDINHSVSSVFNGGSLHHIISKLGGHLKDHSGITSVQHVFGTSSGSGGSGFSGVLGVVPVHAHHNRHHSLRSNQVYLGTSNHQ